MRIKNTLGEFRFCFTYSIFLINIRKHKKKRKKERKKSTYRQNDKNSGEVCRRYSSVCRIPCLSESLSTLSKHRLRLLNGKLKGERYDFLAVVSQLFWQPLRNTDAKIMLNKQAAWSSQLVEQHCVLRIHWGRRSRRDLHFSKYEQKPPI